METDKIDELSLETRLSQLSSETSKHSIYKVPRQLRDVNNQAYEPQIVAIGPYNRGKPKLKDMEEVKLRFMQALLARKTDVPLKDYISSIEGMSKRARDCYAEPPINLKDNEFTDMLVLDGCFIIELIQDSKLFDRTFPGRSSHRTLQRDLILLENQIPLFVLCKLFDLIHGPEQHSLLMKRVLIFCEIVFPGNILYQATTMRSSEEVPHILDLIHSNWCPPPYNSSDHHTISVPVDLIHSNCCPPSNNSCDDASTTMSSSVISTTEPVDDQGCCASWCCPPKTISRVVIPSASELKDANLKFRHKEYNPPPDSDNIFREDRCTTLFDVEFNSGKMLMPRLVIDDGTESLLRNLIAYEQLLPAGRPSYVVDYQILLDCLINTSKDVQILIRGKIIENFLGSDQDVVDLVNKLGNGVTSNSKRFMYEDTFRRINVHHQNCWNRAVATFHRDYFNTPWAYIAFLGALMLFLLTAAQTIFAALQL